MLASRYRRWALRFSWFGVETVFELPVSNSPFTEAQERAIDSRAAGVQPAARVEVASARFSFEQLA